MRHYLGISLRSLKRQKLLTLLTVIAIALSVALISVLGILSDALTQAQIAQAESLSGQYHVHYKGLSEQQLEQLRADRRVEQLGISEVTGSAPIPDENFAVSLEEADPTALELLSMKLLNGHYPTKANEIILDEQTLSYLGIPLKEGAQIELAIDFTAMQADGSFSSTGTERRTFTLAGIMKNHPAAVSGRYGIGFIGLGTFKDLPNSLSAFVRFKDEVDPVKAENELFAQLKLKDWQMDENAWLIAALGYSGNESDEAGNGLTRSSILIGGLVLLAACLVIYNIFQVSVVQRTRQFGMLRAIGATPAQVHKLVLVEALLLCAIGIPLGLLLGTLSSRGVVGNVGAIINPDVLGVDSVDQAVQVVRSSVRTPWLWLEAAAGIGLTATLVSAWLPARLASRVPPVTAIIGLVGSGISRIRRPKKHKLSRHILWQTAKLNLSRNRGRTAVTVISLTMAIITFVTLQSFMQSLNVMEILTENMDSAYSLSTGEGIADKDIADLRSMPGVEQVRTAIEALQPYDIEAQKAAKLQTNEESQAYTIAHTMNVLGYDEKTLQTMLDKLGKDAPTAQQMSEKPLALVWNNEVNLRFLPDWQPPEAGTSLNLFGQLVTVVGAADEIAIHRPYTPLGITLLMHEAQAKRIIPNQLANYADIFLSKTITPEQREQISQRLTSIQANTPNCTLTSLEGVKAEMEESIGAIRSLGYGMVILISVIGALNIMNTTTTSLHTRQAELGTLRAIGMSSGQLNRMVLLESLQYGLRALLLGLPVGILLSALVMSLTRGLDSWDPPVPSVLIATVSALGLCLLAAWSPLSRLKKMNIVESIGRVD
ncbi:MAG: ABC transporter permease [Gorillibacterium sp.]|nr:ABC transporter permease [Gorillibacterium sp.]